VNKLINKQRMAILAGIHPATLSHYLNTSQIPMPSIQVGKRFFFTKEEQEVVIKHCRIRKEAILTLRHYAYVDALRESHKQELRVEE
jgi:hypothetical protein